MIESELRYRKFAPFVRLQIEQEHGAPRTAACWPRNSAWTRMGDVFETDSLMLGMRDLMEIAQLDPDLRAARSRITGRSTNTRISQDSRNIFHIIREARVRSCCSTPTSPSPLRSSASSGRRAEDPKVDGDQDDSLQDDSEDTEILEYLIHAARNGKQVAVAVELKARFDEARQHSAGRTGWKRPAFTSPTAWSV